MVTTTSRGPGLRTCLMCGRVFHSAGPGNRRCRSCESLVEGMRLHNLRLLRLPRGIVPHERVTPDDN